MPYMFCNIQSVCTYAARTATSYWLSTSTSLPMMPVTGDEIRQYISRCVACRASAPLLTVHSQDVSEAVCPQGWTEVWSGYSFVMVS